LVSLYGLIIRMNGSGFPIKKMVTLFAVSTRQLLTRQEDHTLDAVLESVWHKQVLLKVSICVCAFCATDYRQWTTWSDATLFLHNIIFVWVDSDKLNQLNTCSFIVISSVSFGCKCGLGFIFTRQVLSMLWIILISSLIPQEVHVPAVIFYSYFGLRRCGFCGQKEKIDLFFVAKGKVC